MPHSQSHLDRRIVVGVVGDVSDRARSLMDRLDEAVLLVDVGSATPAMKAEIEALFVWGIRSPMVEPRLSELVSLRWIHAASAGVDHVLPLAIDHPNVMVTNSAGVFDQAIAEYVIGLMLGHAKGFVETVHAQQDRRWAYRETLGVSGRVVAIIGLGHLGRAVAALAQALGMLVIGVRATSAAVDGIELVPRHRLSDALSRADFVVMTVPLTSETRGMINGSAFAAMKPSAYVINVARGAVIESSALLDALRRGAIAGAALDVFEQEPLADNSPLWLAPNLLISPHMAGDFEGWELRVLEFFGQNVRRYLLGEPLLNHVLASRGY